ncbi:uncharacterized protein FFB20_15896 [Fusarium fujikuroi]|nr:uncharacterized protein FFB20_15896 [Fusarium fujikuroi]
MAFNKPTLKVVIPIPPNILTKKITK